MCLEQGSSPRQVFIFLDGLELRIRDYEEAVSASAFVGKSPVAHSLSRVPFGL